MEEAPESRAEPEAVLSIAGIREAAARISPYVHHTPVLTCGALDKMSGGRQVFFKCEVFQKTGSFKARGACNAVLLAPSECQDIVTHSSGNHAQVRTSKYVLTKILPGTWYVHKTKRYSTTLWLFYLPDFYFANQRSSQCNSSTYGQNDILVVLVCIQNMVRIVLVYGTRCTSYVHIIRYRSRI